MGLYLKKTIEQRKSFSLGKSETANSAPGFLIIIKAFETSCLVYKMLYFKGIKSLFLARVPLGKVMSL